MALAARDAGYEYLAITDHSASFGFGDEVSPDRLREQIERIRSLSARRGRRDRAAGRLARSTSCPTASLDYDDELLAELDWVVASVHSSFRMDAGRDDRADRARDRATRYVDVIGHLSGRKIERRAPYEFDFEARDRGGRRDRARCSRSTRAPTGATSTRSTRARRRRPGFRS